MGRKLFLAFLFVFLFQLNRSEAKVLVIGTSDQHSFYQRLPLFIRNLAKVRRDFLNQNPFGKVILAINGDFNGRSSYALDRGTLGYDVVKFLARDYEVIMNLGNHEAFDWSSKFGNRLFVRQARELTGAISTDERQFRFTTANLQLTDLGKEFFEPYHDVKDGDRRIRFVGLVLNRFFEVSRYQAEGAYQLFEGMTPMEEEARTQLLAAAKDGVDNVVFLCHENFGHVKQLVRDLDLWRNNRKLKLPKVSVAFAGHDHHIDSLKLRGSLAIDAGLHYDFSTVVLDDQGQVEDFQIYDESAQKALKEPIRMTNAEVRAYVLASETVARIKNSGCALNVAYH